MLTKYNRKTVTISTDEGQRWNVALKLLRKADSMTTGHVEDNVVHLKKE